MSFYKPLQKQDKECFNQLTPENVQFLRNRYNKVNRWVIADMIRRSAYHYPHKPALISQQNSMTYSQLEKECNKLANAFIDLGVKRYERVAILAHNTIHHVMTWIACCKAGAVYLAINYLLNGEEIAYCINHSESRVFIVEDSLYDLVQDTQDDMSTIKAWIWSNQGSGQPIPNEDFLDFEDWYTNYPGEEPDTTLHIEDPCQMTYTSGTESKPKGVIINHQSLLSEYMGCIVDGEYKPDDVNINAMPIYHCAQRDVFLNPIFWLGGTNILAGPDIEEILQNIEKYSATMLFAPPTVWIGILRHPSLNKYDLSSLQKIYYGASIMPVEVLKELMQQLPNTKVYNFYGQTELAPYHTILKSEDALSKLGSAGRGGLNMETKLEDEEENTIENPDIPGEICGRGPHAMLMYYKDPEKTEYVMRNDWFHTGDIGIYDEDGYISVVDRRKDMVKTGGENVASREVEEAIYQDSRVEEVAVIGVPHPKWMEAVIAVVVPKTGEEIKEQEIMDLCSKHLARFKTPKQVFVANYLPKTPTGKILKKDMREFYKDIFNKES